jgi:glycosyltransferase involved in cell wall biosynthesis
MRQRSTEPQIVHVTTVPMSLATHLAGQVGYVQRRGYGVHVITSPGPELAPFADREGVPVIAIPMTRTITPFRDLVALARLWRALRRIRPAVVHSHTPKGGLLGMIAAWLARTPVRIYHIRGLPLVTATGLRRALLRATEWTSCRLAHRVLAVSHSMRRIAVEEGLCPAEKLHVPLGGSGNGVDARGKFTPRPPEVRAAARALHGVPAGALVVGFVGRLMREKGVVELAAAWRELRERDPRLHLLLVGWLELEPEVAGAAEALRADPRVHFTGPSSDLPPLYAAMDLVTLPTYREGFPNVALEAAAMALPIVATSVPGCLDAVEDGVTGTLVPPRDAAALARAIAGYADDPALRERHGEAARSRVLARFAREAIWEAIASEYAALLAPHGAAGALARERLQGG